MAHGHGHGREDDRDRDRRVTITGATTAIETAVKAIDAVLDAAERAGKGRRRLERKTS